MSNKNKKDGTADFMVKLVQLKSDAGKLGLYRTMHSLELPQKMAGWEMAERLGDKVNWNKLYKQWKKELNIWGEE